MHSPQNIKYEDLYPRGNRPFEGHNFGWKAFWDSNPERSCLKLTLD